MRISDWSSDVCSSDPRAVGGEHVVAARDRAVAEAPFEVGNQVAVVARVGLHGLAFVLARFAQVGGVGPARQPARADVAAPVLAGAEGGAKIVRASCWERVFPSVLFSVFSVSLQ